MARNIKQSTQSSNTDATVHRETRWNTEFEKKLAKFGQPALHRAFQIAVECSSDQFMRVDDLVKNARVNPHEFTEASFPLDMPDLYVTFELYGLKVCREKDGNPDFLPTLEGYIAWLVVSKLWHLCDSATNSTGQVFSPAMVREITGICLLAEHAQRICNSVDRAIAARKSLKPNYWKHVKKAERQRENFWDKAEQCLYERHSNSRWLYPSLEAMAMNISETNVTPFDFLECFTILLSFEEQM